LLQRFAKGHERPNAVNLLSRAAWIVHYRWRAAKSILS